MVFPSSYIAQSIHAQNSMFSGMQAYAQQASYGAGLMQGPAPPAAPPMPPPPPPSLMGVMRGHGGYAGGPTTGAWGESMAGRLATMGQMGMGFAGAGMSGLGIASSLGLVGGPLGAIGAMADPFGMALRAGGGAFSAAGGGLGGMAAGGLAAGAVALPLYAGAQYVSALGRNFTGGMQDQMSLNNVLRQNFTHLGGQGAFGRGFNQQQMGQIGGFVSQELRNNVFTSAGEMNQVIAGGAQMGTFTGVRDAQEFGRRFREMISTLRTVQRELGGSLAEAQEFISQSRQAGIFGSTQATRFASTIRATSASTGFDQGQLMQLAANGASIARQFGGNGSQGAFGALRGISTISTAMNNGMLSEGMLSEATGGLTGQDAMQAFVGDMMQRTGRFSRRAMGRFSIFGLSNRDGTGLDEGALMRFQMGDIGVGELSRMAHGRVGEMGRARAMNREGLLRGALMEQGGITGQIGMMRMMVGDRVMDQGDDMVSLVMQRRFGMSRPQAEVMTTMMRNQGSIANEEITDRISSGRETAMRAEVREHRSIDAFSRHISHAVQENTGMLAARDLGRDFVTRMSSMAERVMNDLLGIASENMSRETRQSFSRMSVGQGRAEDFAVMRAALSGANDTRMVSGGAGYNRGVFQTGFSLSERLERFGFDPGGFGGGLRGTSMRELTGGRRVAFSGHFRAGEEMSPEEMERASRTMMLATSGVATGRARDVLRDLEGDVGGSRMRILEAMSAARGGGDVSQFYSFLGGGNADPTRSAANAAFMARHGMANPMGLTGTDVSMSGGGGITWGMIGRDALRAGALGVATIATGGTALLGIGAAAAADRIAGGGESATGIFRSEIYDEMNRGEAERMSAADYFAGGGGAARDLRTAAAAARRRGDDTGARRFELQAQDITGVSRDMVSEVMGRADVRSATAGILSDDPTARANAVERLAGLAATETDPERARAFQSILMNARRAARTEDPEARRAFLDTTVPVEERVRYERETMDLGRTYSAIAARMESRGGGSADLRQALSGIGSRLTGLREAERAYGEIGQLTEGMIGLNDAEFQEEMSGLMDLGEGASEEERLTARRLAMTVSSGRSEREALLGRGRRGMRQSRETALSMLTGSSLGSMEFSLGGRRVSGRNAASLLTGGGARSEDMRRQLIDQLVSSGGMSRSAATEISGALGEVYADRRVTGEEADRLRGLRRTYGADFERIEREGRERALSAASSRDPVGAETNRLLGEVNSVLRERLAPREGGAAPETATPT